jgi:hypothetical protein
LLVLERLITGLGFATEGSEDSKALIEISTEGNQENEGSEGVFCFANSILTVTFILSLRRATTMRSPFWWVGDLTGKLTGRSVLVVVSC